MDQLTLVEVEAIRIGRENIGLASEVLRLAEEKGRGRSVEESHAPGTQHEIERLQGELKKSRQKWKVLKGTAGAVVAGSGVNWDKDPQLRDVVLDTD
jgi:hypothetical protein